MSKIRAEIDGAFQAAAVRPTAQRFAVLDWLVRHPAHATAAEIFKAVNRTDPRASRATVYNSLRALSRAGLVREVTSEGKAARFDANLVRHHHFVCDRCGTVEDVAWFDLPASSRGLGNRRVRDYEVVFRGTCEACGPGGKNPGTAGKGARQ